jgi:hypothetical protein
MEPAALAILPFLAAFAFYPLLSAPETVVQRVVTAGMVILGVLILAIVAVRDPASPRTPRAVQAFYLEDAASGHAWRASTFPRLDLWSKAALGPGPIQKRDLGPMFDKPWLAPAPTLSLARPTFAETAQPAAGARRITLAITPHGGGRELRLYLRPTTLIADVRMNGHATELAPKPGAWVQLRWEAPAGPVSLSFTAKSAGALDLRYAEIADGWPAGVSVPAKPADDMPWGLSDKTVLLDRYAAKW